jgi:hypothetical protein
VVTPSAYEGVRTRCFGRHKPQQTLSRIFDQGMKASGFKMTLRQQWTWRENQALARKLEAAKLMLKMTFRTSGA